LTTGNDFLAECLTPMFVRWFLLSCLAVIVQPLVARSADEFERPPIRYSTTTPDNRISQLQTQLDSGKLKLEYEPRFGFLRGVLQALDVPVESQVLVFSKTSLQVQRITPATPRAIYFSDDVYLGFVQNGDALEVSIADPQLGAVFYTLEQSRNKLPKFERQTDNCLICHGSSRTENVPGHLVRSLMVSSSGQPLLSAGSQTVDHTTPFAERWGGWYVTGKHGAQKHLGNLIIQGREVPKPLDNSTGLNQTVLPEHVNAERYLSPHSDLVALMVLEHQVLVHNRITKANFAARSALAYDGEMKKVLGERDGQFLDSTVRRLHGAADELLEALLFVDEAKLSESVSGTSGYATTFVKQGPRDKQGRSLRDFDLKTRMFKYPCSYLIASPTITALPAELQDMLWAQLDRILRGEEQDKQKYAHLSAADRQAIREILLETLPAVTKNWQPAASARK
jgi:hypothetical protein